MFFRRLYDLRTDNDLTQQQVADYLINEVKVGDDVIIVDEDTVFSIDFVIEQSVYCNYT